MHVNTIHIIKNTPPKLNPMINHVVEIILSAVSLTLKELHFILIIIYFE